MGGFYAAVITGKEAVPYVPRPLDDGEAQEHLHIQTFSIPADCDIPTGTRVSVMLKAEDDPPACVCTLTCGAFDSMLSSVMVDAYAELSLVCSSKKLLAKAAVHATGIFVPAEGDEDGDEDDQDDDISAAQMLQKQLANDLNGLIGKPSGLGEIDDEDDSDGEEDDDEDEKIVTRFGGRKHVEITELPDGDDDDDDDDSDEETADDNDANAENKATLNVATLEGKGKQVSAAAAAAKKSAKTESAAAVRAEASDESDGDDDNDDSDAESESEEDEDPDPAEAVLPPMPPANGVRGAKPAAAAEDIVNSSDADKDSDDDGDESEDEASDDDDDEDDVANGVATGAAAAAAPAPAAGQPANGKRKADPEPAPTSTKKQKKTAFANGFEVHEVATGPHPKAAIAVPGKRVSVRYTGTLQSTGKVFDKTKGNKPFCFRLGVGEVIKGWDKGLAGMRVGDKRKLVVPPSMAYGETGVRDVIPKNATLLFDVELVNVH